MNSNIFSEKYPNQFTNFIKPNYKDQNQILIEPPNKETVGGRRVKMLLVDSRDRNRTIDPDPANYTIELNTNYKDVIEAELISAYIPKSEYQVNQYNNKLYFVLRYGDQAEGDQYGGGGEWDGLVDEDFNTLKTTTTPAASGPLFAGWREATIPIGNYYDDNDIKGKERLAYVINQALIATVNDNNDQYTIKVIYDRLTDKYIFYNDVASRDFIMVFFGKEEWYGAHEKIDGVWHGQKEKIYPDISMGELLGYNQENVLSLTTSAATSYTSEDKTTAGTTIYNPATAIFVFDDKDSYEIDTIDTTTKHVISAQNNPDFTGEKYVLLKIPQFHRYHSNLLNVQKSFVQIPLVNSLMFENSKAYGNVKYFYPPLPKLNKLKVQFITRSGRNYDFNGKEHYFILALTLLNQSQKYLPLNSQYK